MAKPLSPSSAGGRGVWVRVRVHVLIRRVSPRLVRYYRLVANAADYVERAQRGDRNAFNQLVIEHRDRVYTHCLYTLHNAENAADVTQDAFIKAWRNIGSLRGAFRPWLLTIATNACRDFIRAQKT